MARFIYRLFKNVKIIREVTASDSLLLASECAAQPNQQKNTRKEYVLVISILQKLSRRGTVKKIGKNFYWLLKYAHS